ncbi:MAG: hypothetical protein ACYDA5_01030 [Vulcanimicrobiaceae bacterium]
MKRLAIAGAVVLAFALAACGQHGQGITPSGPVPAAHGMGIASFIIKVPKAATTSSTNPNPNYISAATQSVTITVSGVSTPTTVNLTPSSPNCSSSSGTLTCTASVPAPIGSDTFTLTMFDKTNGAGNQLSTGTVTATINAGTTNNVPVILNGVVASVAVSLANPAPAVGVSATIPLTVTAMDADGDTIVGPGNYTPTITLSTSDSTNAALSSTTVSAPGAAVTVTYSGAAISSATITATITGTSTSATTKLTPANSQNGSGAVGVVTIGGTTYAEVPSAGGLLQIQIASSGTISAARALQPIAAAAPAPSPSPLVLTPAPDACAIGPGPGPSYGIFAYCITYNAPSGPQGIINVVDLTSGTPTFVRSITTDASASTVSFSGAYCYICGVAWDGKDNAIIISTANGYEFYDPGTASGKQVIATIPAPISENFGYNSATDQIWSPTYTEVDLVDVASRTWYTLTGASISSDWDGGAVDSSTNIGMAVDESPTYDSFVPLDSANAILSTPPPAAGTAGTFTDANANATTTTSDAGCRSTAFAIDSTTHLAFLSGEFSTPDCVGVIQLPSAPLTAPFTPTTWMFIPAMPNTPDGNPFQSADDPHVAMTFYIPGSSDLFGAIFNYTRSYVAVVDITKLLAAPSSSTDPHQISPTYDPVANGVLFYIATGYTGGPATLRAHHARE